MNELKKAWISVTRRWGKSILYFMLIILLAMIAVGGYSVYIATGATTTNLRNRMPAILTVRYVQDIEEVTRIYEETGTWEQPPNPTPEFIRQIGQFPQVAFYDFSIDLGWWSVFATDLTPFRDEFFPPMFGDYIEGLGTALRPRGVTSTDFIRTREGVIELVAGRTFTADELENSTTYIPILISTGLANANNLSIGSLIESHVTTQSHSYQGGGIYSTDREAPPVYSQDFALEVIGIFEPKIAEITAEMEMDEAFQLNRIATDVHRRIYLPNFAAEEMFNARVYGETLVWGEEFVLADVFLHSFFVLKSPELISQFMLQVENLDGNWEVFDLSGGFDQLSGAMQNFAMISSSVLIFSIFISIILIILVILLYLKDRKTEIGAYLALGCSKSKIISQLLIEHIPLAMVALLIAIILGQIFAQEISQNLLISELETQSTVEVVQGYDPLSNLGYRFIISTDEMFESYEVGLEIGAILAFLVGGFIVVFVSTLIPVYITVNKNPKQLLIS